MERMVLSGGYEVTVKKGLSVSVAGEKKEPAIAWLAEHGFADIVTLDVLVAFGLGQTEEASSLSDVLVNAGLSPLIKRDVNTARLKALIAEQLEKGGEVDLDTLGAYEYRKSVIKPPKEGKKK